MTYISVDNVKATDINNNDINYVFTSKMNNTNRELHFRLALVITISRKAHLFWRIGMEDETESHLETALSRNFHMFYIKVKLSNQQPTLLKTRIRNVNSRKRFAPLMLFVSEYASCPRCLHDLFIGAANCNRLSDTSAQCWRLPESLM